MSDLDIRRLDPAAPGFDPLLAAWHRAYVASDVHEHDGPSPYRLPELRDMATVPTGFRRVDLYAAWRDGSVVGTGFLDLTLADNLHLAQVEVQVPPEHRRAGVGSALLLELEERARAAGRSTVVGEITWPLDAPVDGAGTPGRGFADRHGYEVALGDVQRRIALPLDAGLLDRLAAEAAPHHAAYRLEAFRGPVPEEWVAGYAALAASLVTEAPAGDLDMEGEDPSVAGWREKEEAFAREGLTLWHAIALDPAGEVVAYTSIAVSEHDPALCHQWGTLVRSDHRGHRLGLAVKVANHRALQASGTVPDELVTWNAEVNAPMIGVNDQLGFHKVERLGEVQKRL